MFLRSVFFVLAAAATAATVEGASDIGRTVYFESHGRDDLREWPAALRKGVQYIKIDFNFQTDPYTCAVQRRLPYPSNASAYAGGCFLLCHYYKNATRDFNTTSDVLDAIASPTLREYFSSTDRVVTIQMCQKNAPANMCTSSDGAKWIALYDAFYHAAQARIAAHGLTVRFVFDSLDSPCLFDRWTAWPYTFTGNFAHAHDNNATNGDDRYQMVNMAYDSTKAWDKLGAHGFYKFVNSSFAFVAWEPSDQYQIQEFLRRYEGYGVYHTPGMLMAYNGDPAMFHVFTANITGRYSNNVLKALPANKDRGAAPLAARVGDKLLLACTQGKACDSSTHTSQLSCVMSERGANGRMTTVDQRPLTLDVACDTITAVAATALSAGSFNVTVATSGCCTAAYRVTWSALGSHVTPLATLESASACPAWTAINVTGPFLSAASFANHDLLVCAVIHYTVASANALDVALQPLPSGAATVVRMTAAAYGNSSNSGATIVDGATIAVAAVVSGNGANIVATWAWGRGVYAATAVVGSAGITVTPPAAAAPVKLAVGRNPSLSMTSDGHVLVLFGESFCYNSQLMDDDMLEFFGDKVCDVRDKRVYEVFESKVQNYVYGPFNVLTERLSRGNRHLHGVATVCDAELLHGTFDSGSMAAAVLLERAAGDDFVAAGGHVALAVQRSLDLPELLCICGTPNSHGGAIVLNAFPLSGIYNASAVARR